MVWHYHHYHYIYVFQCQVEELITAYTVLSCHHSYSQTTFIFKTVHFKHTCNWNGTPYCNFWRMKQMLMYWFQVGSLWKYIISFTCLQGLRDENVLHLSLTDVQWCLVDHSEHSLSLLYCQSKLCSINQQRVFHGILIIIYAWWSDRYIDTPLHIMWSHGFQHTDPLYCKYCQQSHHGY